MTNDDPFIRIEEVKVQTGLAKSTIYNLMGKGKFPKPVKPTPHLSAWVTSEVNDWKLSCMNDRNLIH